MPRVSKPKREKKPYTRKKENGTFTATNPGGYNRALLVEEVAKVTNADFDKVGVTVGKTGTQCKDTWRKTVFRALLSGGEWCVTGPGWDKTMKQALANEIFDSAKPNWDDIAPSFPGKTAAQVKDVWRKVVLPKIRKGQVIG